MYFEAPNFGHMPGLRALTAGLIQVPLPLFVLMRGSDGGKILHNSRRISLMIDGENKEHGVCSV